MKTTFICLCLVCSFNSFAEQNKEITISKSQDTEIHKTYSFTDNNHNLINCTTSKNNDTPECKNQNGEIVLCSNSDQNGFTCSAN